MQVKLIANEVSGGRPWARPRPETIVALALIRAFEEQDRFYELIGAAKALRQPLSTDQSQ